MSRPAIPSAASEAKPTPLRSGRRAFIVTDRWEEEMEIVFAENAREAKANRSGDLWGDTDYTDLRVRREPKFDDVTNDPPLPHEFIERGWWLHCQNCSAVIDEYRFYPHVRPGDGLPMAVYHPENGHKDESIFCSSDCRDKYTERWSKKAAEKPEDNGNETAETPDNLA